MKTIISHFLFFTVFTSVFFADPIDKIATLIQQGQSQELVKQFAASTELDILGDESVVNKAQAETKLNAFFSNNKPLAVKVIHRMTTNPNLLYAVAQLKTSTGNFRVSYSIKNTNGVQELTELRIEAEKG